MKKTNLARYFHLRWGRFEARLHLLLPVAAAAFTLLGGDLWLRYLLLLSTLLLHELGHAGAALLLGARKARVSVWPLFGRADVERFGDRREALVAAAGPLVNLLAAAALALSGADPTLAIARAPLPDFLLLANLLLGTLNLIPVPPADGGLVLRALRPREAAPARPGPGSS